MASEREDGPGLLFTLTNVLWARDSRNEAGFLLPKSRDGIDMLAACCWRLNGIQKVKMQCTSRIKATNPLERQCLLRLLHSVSLGIFAHGASHFSPICTTISHRDNTRPG